MLFYVVSFSIISILPYVLGFITGIKGAIYFIAAAIVGLLWVYYAINGFKAKDSKIWAMIKIRKWVKKKYVMVCRKVQVYCGDQKLMVWLKE